MKHLPFKWSSDSGRSLGSREAYTETWGKKLQITSFKILPMYRRNQSIREKKGQIRDCVKHEFEGESKQIHHVFPKN